MSGTLYLCATPIGNLEDITLRVLRTLQEVDLIAAEDTRNTIKLLNHFEIKTPMTSYHEHNKIEKASHLVNQLLDGTNIALVTDAGTPGISDPGEEIVKQAYEAGVTVTSLPGACACVTALTLSGLSTRRFTFEAFLPTDKKERRKILQSLCTETRTIVIYEAPHHLKNTLQELYSELGERKLTVCREITKIHETVQLFTLSSAISYFEENTPRGEFVLVLEGRNPEELEQEAREAWNALSVPEHMEQYLARGMQRKEAMKQVAKDRGVPKRDIYQILLESE
ncbi:MAG: 16S rRNA (cytidine(1402)-2'-O)-methyltransferase [Lachnospiraceae bacterium]|nr:16S rRNA (cytidine(1402)-2'-O)-methyltransferase [Lachnospiraceae bacterium]